MRIWSLEKISSSQPYSTSCIRPSEEESSAAQSPSLHARASSDFHAAAPPTSAHDARAAADAHGLLRGAPAVPHADHADRDTGTAPNQLHRAAAREREVHPGAGLLREHVLLGARPPPPAPFDRERASRAEGAARSRRDRARCPSRRGDRACRLEILKRAAPRPSCHRITAVSDATRVVDSKTFLFSRTRADLPPTLTALRSPTSSRARTSWSRRTSSRPTTRARRAASAAGATAASTTTFRRCTSTSSTTTGSE